MYPPSINKIMAVCEKKLDDKISKLIAQMTSEDMRKKYLQNKNLYSYSNDDIRDAFKKASLEFFEGKPNKAINATGIILHSNLGRSPLSKRALEAICKTANYSPLAQSTETGIRIDRDRFVSKLICSLTGAENATVVNNNTAGFALVINTFSKNKKTIVSRGELVKIGGSFSLPEILESSGGILKEIGCTNKTNIIDYEKATDENTALYLKVSTSNFTIEGFHEEVKTEELSKLAKEKNIIFAYDLGSASFADMSEFGFSNYKDPIKILKDGADIILFSADKILGGPQAGIIIGKDKYIKQIKQNPLFRAVRLDKITLSALSETILTYFDEKNIKEIPFIKMICYNIEDLQKKANKFYSLVNLIELEGKINITNTHAYAGCGSMPNEKIDSIAVTLETGIKSTEFANFMRKEETPIFVRIKEDKAYFDMRTTDEEDFEIIANSIKKWYSKNDKGAK